jgi:hypothetical protein
MSWVLCVRPTRVPLLAETAALCFGRRVVDSSDHNRDMSWVLCVRPTRVLLLAEIALLCLGRYCGFCGSQPGHELGPMC